MLGDIVGPGRRRECDRPAEARGGWRGDGPTRSTPAEPAGGRRRSADGIVVLDRVHRFGGGIARLAEAIRRGDADGVLEVLAAGPTA